MAQIAPFRGILYDPSQVEASAVLAPPYDAIDAHARTALAERHPANSVRLILPEGEGEARYANAAQTLDAWLESGVLVRDQRPAVYRYHQSFTTPALAGRRVTRHSFIAMVRLHDFAEGVVRPHAQTLEAPRADRLQLMRATSAHLSPVLGLYSDPSGRSDELFRTIENRDAPCVEATTDDGTQHTLWRVCDAETIGKLDRVIAPLTVYLADGHHRYEAMLAWRQELRDSVEGGLGTYSGGEFATMALSNMDDVGLAVGPIHRLVSGLPDFDSARVLFALDELFDVVSLRGGATSAERIGAALDAAGGDRPSFVAVLAGSDNAHVLTVRGNVDARSQSFAETRVVGGLDVAILHELVLSRCLGIDLGAESAHAVLSYAEEVEEALAAVSSGAAQACFLLRPTRVSQLRAVADAGERMPTKSIAFYPKVASGLVFNHIDPDRDVR